MLSGVDLADLLDALVLLLLDIPLTAAIDYRFLIKVSEIADESFYRRGKLPDSGLIGHMHGLVADVSWLFVHILNLGRDVTVITRSTSQGIIRRWRKTIAVMFSKWSYHVNCDWHDHTKYVARGPWTCIDNVYFKKIYTINNTIYNTIFVFVFVFKSLIFFKTEERKRSMIIYN